MHIGGLTAFLKRSAPGIRLPPRPLAPGCARAGGGGGDAGAAGGRALRAPVSCAGLRQAERSAR